jgi:FkbM family methyltransferase
MGRRLYRDELGCIGERLRRMPSPEQVLVDVGANIGFHALRMREYCANPIVCFEPNPLTYAVLLANLENNRLTHPDISAQNLACSDIPGQLTVHCGFNSYVTDEDANFHEHLDLDFDALAAAIDGGWIRARASVIRLDDVLPRTHVGFLKIDVEGFEHKVLSGARKLVQRDRPEIFVELHSRDLPRNGSSVQSVCAMVRSWGYVLRFFDFSPPEPKSRVPRLLMRYVPRRWRKYRDEAEALASITPGTAQLHLLAVPTERGDV